MRLHTAPAAYARFFTDLIESGTKDAALDADFRSDESPRVRAFANVPDALLEPERTGTLVIISIDADNPDDVAALTDIIRRVATRSH